MTLDARKSITPATTDPTFSRWVGGYCGLGTCGANNSVGDAADFGKQPQHTDPEREARTSKTITLEVAESIENVTAKMAN